MLETMSFQIKYVAEICESADVLRMDVCAPGEEAAFSRRRIRAGAGVAARPEPRLAFAAVSRARRFAPARAASQLFIQN